MNYENVLLIGGPKDGTRMSVLSGVQRIQFAEASATGHGPYGGSSPTVMDVQHVVYRLESVQSSRGTKGAIYVIDNGVDALQALIEGYRGSRNAFEALARKRGYNTDQDEEGYISKMTTELWEFWCSGTSK